MATKEKKPVIELGDEWRELRTAAATLDSTKKSMSVLEEQKDTLIARIKELTAEFEIDEATVFQMPGISVTLTPTKGRKTLNKDRLIDAGVMPSQIENGYNVGEGYISVSVSIA